MVYKKIFLIFVFLIFLINFVSAHCPLCTIGAGVAAGAAVYLGVSKIIVALFIGAFAVSIGWWFGNIIKKRYIPFQKTSLIVGSFLLTVIPLMPLFNVIGPLYLPFIGEYGKTYAINYALIGSIFGGLVVTSTPSISQRITKLRKGKMVPFQGIILTFILLLIIALIIQFTIV
ncbi:hypothetical protein COU53_01140 [Candidatus Pacearchaeota archaeon CG10_big_fil_rev_8_21_14_0_10_30_48]|nr:MAG: hypothetical protein COU53_01140 [Candidatus Pacearchaeota archaeon CG10_big_fil_rev_8_21_14_0_10_30_48]